LHEQYLAKIEERKGIGGACAEYGERFKRERDEARTLVKWLTEKCEQTEKERDVARATLMSEREAYAKTTSVQRTSLDAVQARLVEVEKERDALHAVVEAFAVTVDTAVAAFARRGKGGQQAPFHGDFCPDSMGPSAISRLTWWVREMRNALGKGEG
jgi:hypothetical protein